MLNSLLNRDFRKIVIDRVKRTDSQGNIELLTDPKDIHDHADATYAKHFRKRNHLFDSDTSIWRQWENEYSPKPNIDPAIFSKLATEPTKQEWLTTLQACKNSSAAGLSGIGYKMLKHLPECLNRSLRKLSFICFNSGLVSEQWKWSQVYPIPKPSDWNFNLDITRPILLLECCRKLTVKILTQRLSDVCRQHNVLKGNNYAALKGGSTQTPIHTLNNIIEDARESKQQLWIAFQDMAKAFDSVGLTPLKYALNRIKISEHIQSFIIDLFNNRSL